MTVSIDRTPQIDLRYFDESGFSLTSNSPKLLEYIEKVLKGFGAEYIINFE